MPFMNGYRKTESKKRNKHQIKFMRNSDRRNENRLSSHTQNGSASEQVYGETEREREKRSGIVTFFCLNHKEHPKKGHILNRHEFIVTKSLSVCAFVAVFFSVLVVVSIYSFFFLRLGIVSVVMLMIFRFRLSTKPTKCRHSTIIVYFIDNTFFLNSSLAPTVARLCVNHSHGIPKVKLFFCFASQRLFVCVHVCVHAIKFPCFRNNENIKCKTTSTSDFLYRKKLT